MANCRRRKGRQTCPAIVFRYKKNFMSLYRKIRKLFNAGGHAYVELLSRQTEYLVRTTSLLYDMFSTADREVWEKNEKEINAVMALYNYSNAAKAMQ